MVRISAILLGFVSIAWCENSLTRQERREGFELLFDGKTLRRWHSIKLGAKPAVWRVRKGILTYEPGDSWLATDDTYFDFVLRLEYRAGPESDSGIFLRAAPSGDPSLTGMKLQIKSNDAGSLSGAVAAVKNMSKPDGQWNQVEITVVRRQVTAVWNSEKILDVNLDDAKYAGTLAARPAYGHVGLQARTAGGAVEFRNIRIKVLKIGPLFIPGK